MRGVKHALRLGRGLGRQYLSQSPAKQLDMRQKRPRFVKGLKKKFEVKS